MKGCILIIVFFIAGCASMSAPRDPWTKTDTALQVTYSALHIMDWSQTLHSARNPEKYYETNPLLGSHPSEGRVNSMLALSLIAHTTVAYILPKPYRGYWQLFWMGVEVEAVKHNRAAGIGLSIHF